VSSRVSVLIPARNEPFLNRTIQSVLDMATEDVEVIICLDGAPPVEPIIDDPRVRVIEKAEAEGIGAASWDMAQSATGEYVMKLDAHCLLAPGWDMALKEHCGPSDLLVPARYQLKDEKWKRGYGPIHYLFLTYPWLQEPQFGAGIHGKKWQGPDGTQRRAVGREYFWPERAWAERAPLDDIMSFQGSLWFMQRERFLALDGVDRRCILWGEAINLGCKVWLSGGRCLRDKSTWYAHLHKGRKHGRGYWMNKRRMQIINLWTADYWMNDRWEHPLKSRSWRWFVEHFWPIPSWPDDWDDPHYQDEFVYPGLKKETQWTLLTD